MLGRTRSVSEDRATNGLHDPDYLQALSQRQASSPESVGQGQRRHKVGRQVVVSDSEARGIREPALFCGCDRVC
jgi:hypothetical protein